MQYSIVLRRILMRPRIHEWCDGPERRVRAGRRRKVFQRREVEQIGVGDVESGQLVRAQDLWRGRQRDAHHERDAGAAWVEEGGVVVVSAGRVVLRVIWGLLVA